MIAMTVEHPYQWAVIKLSIEKRTQEEFPLLVCPQFAISLLTNIFIVLIETDFFVNVNVQMFLRGAISD